MDRAHNLAREIRALRALMMATAKAVNPSAGLSELLKALDGLSMALLRLSAVISRDMLSKRAYRHLLCRLIEPQAEACDLHQSQQR